MTTTSDRDGREPPEPDRSFPAPPHYGVTPDDADGQSTVILTPYGELPAYSQDDVLPRGPVGGRRTMRGAARTPRRTGPTPLGRVVLPAALALVSAIALVAGWSTLQEDRAAQGQASAVHQSVAPAASQTPVAAAPKAVASSAPAASHQPSPASSAPVAPAPDRSVPVVVLNSTTRTGLAAAVAAQLRKDGWKVVAIGNYRPRIAATTVYAEGHRAAVSTIRGDLPTRDAVRTPVGAMSRARITVVLGPDYPRG